MESGRAQGAHRARAGRQQQMAATERGHRPREKAEGRPVAEGKGRDFEAADGGHRAAAREQEDSGERERESRERDGRCAGSSAGRADDARAVRRVMVPAEETFGASRTRYPLPIPVTRARTRRPARPPARSCGPRLHGNRGGRRLAEAGSSPWQRRR